MMPGLRQQGGLMYLNGMESSTLIALNAGRLNGLKRAGAMEQLGTGMRVNRGADDPSGLGIGQGMLAQIRGISTALHNAQESKDLIHTADGGLAEIHDILMRQQDICIRGANEATLYTATSANPNDISPSPTRTLFNELVTLDKEIYETVQRLRFNTKQLLFGFNNGRNVQEGPDNETSHRIEITIPDLSIMGTATPMALPGTITHDQFVAAFQNALDLIQDDIATVSDARAQLGEQENRISHTIDDLTAQYINITAGRSHIMDADMAASVTELTRAALIEQSGAAVVQVTQASRGIISNLLDAAGLDASQRVDAG